MTDLKALAEAAKAATAAYIADPTDRETGRQWDRACAEFSLACTEDAILELIRERDEAREARDNEALRGDEVVKMLQAAERERDEAREAVDADEQVIAERDSYHEWADKLAHAVGGLEVGEHSNINNPWQNAIEMAETLHARAEAAEAALSAAQEEVARMQRWLSYVERELVAAMERGQLHHSLHVLVTGTQDPTDG